MKQSDLIIDKAIIGSSQAIHEVRCFLKFAAATSASVLITGPSGSGKEVVANTLHRVSPRRDQSFVAVNSGAVPKELMEAEFFGYEKGSFTGATGRHMGHFERAHNGTLFLDEIGEMAPDMQVRLLRILEDGKVRRVGGSSDIAVDVRMIAATHQSLEDQIAHGAFREDLYYRLCVLPLHMPALKERREDVEPLVRHFLRDKNGDQGRACFTKDALQMLMDHDWPGNVRELRNVVLRAKIVYPQGWIGAEQLQKLMYAVPKCQTAQITPAVRNPVHEMVDAIRESFAMDAGCGASAEPAPVTVEAEPAAEASVVAISGPEDAIPEAFSLKAHLQREERRLLTMALEQTNGVVAAAARLLKLERTTFVEKMKRYNIVRDNRLAA